MDTNSERGHSNDNSPAEQAGSRLKNGQFAKGVSGNPFGRPKHALSWPGELRRWGEKKRKKGKGLTLMEEACRKMWELAAQGDVRACQLIMERMEGRPVAPIDMNFGNDELVFIGGMEVPKPNEKPHE